MVVFQIEKDVFQQQTIIEISFKLFRRKNEAHEADQLIYIVQIADSLVHERDTDHWRRSLNID